MEFRRIWTLRGPNIWSRSPVLEVEIDVPAAGLAVDAALLERLASWLPEFMATLPAGSDSLAHIFQHLSLWLQVYAGSDVTFGMLRPAAHPDQKDSPFFRVIVEFEEEALAQACIQAAREICAAASAAPVGQAFQPAGRLESLPHAAQPYDVHGTLQSLRNLAYDVRMGPSTASIVTAARRRSIPFQRLSEGSLVQLGFGARQHRICAAETDRTSAIAESIAQDKQLTRTLLQTAGVPAPVGRPVNDADDAWEAAQELGLPVVVKPRYGNHGRGVATNLNSREQVIQAYNVAREESSYIVVETFAPGADHRVLVIGDAVVAAALREPAHVIGDGASTITALIEEVNRDPGRSDGHGSVLSYIKIDPVALGVLAEQGLTPESIPAVGQKVLIRRNANLSTGGTATDVTDLIHPDVAQRCVDATKAVGLDVAGVDVVAVDISKPLEAQKGVIVEINAGPGLRMHLEPSSGKARPVGEAVVATLFKEGETGRIPIIAVTGVNGKTTTTRMLARVFRRLGRTVGMTCTDGMYINERRTLTRDCAGPQSARAMLLNPRIEVAVFETARGGILREGLGVDLCDAAVVTNIGEGDHLGLRGIETLEELARVKRVVVEAVAAHGFAVLNADDSHVVAMAGHCPGKVIFFSQDEQNAVLADQRRAGQRVVFTRAGWVVLSEGDQEWPLIRIDDIPSTHQGKAVFQIDNVLATIAAAWAMQVPTDVITDALRTFSADADQSPGRFNVLHINGATVIVDYAHNPSAVAALASAVERFPQPRRKLIYSGCNRRDSDLLAMGETLGRCFDRVVLYQDRNNIDRADGELNAVLRRGLERGRRVREIIESPDEMSAIRDSLSNLEPDEIVVIGVEAIEPALDLIRTRLPSP